MDVRIFFIFGEPSGTLTGGVSQRGAAALAASVAERVCDGSARWHATVAFYAFGGTKWYLGQHLFFVSE